MAGEASLPVWIKWNVHNSDDTTKGAGTTILFPGINKNFSFPRGNKIGAYFPENEEVYTTYLRGKVSVTPIFHRLFPDIFVGDSCDIPSQLGRYTLHLERVNSSNNSNPNPSPNWNWIGENFVYYVDNSSYINISMVDNGLFRMNIRNLLENLQGFRLIYTFAADSGDSKLDIYSE